MKQPTLTPQPGQHGVALVVVLVLVLLVTLLGIAAVRTLTVQERMASNSFDRSLALQSADRVLRDAEQLALAQSLTVPFNAAFASGTDTVGFTTRGGSNLSCVSPTGSDPSTCQNGYCSQPSPTCATRWTDANFSGWVTVTSAASDSGTSTSDATLSVGTQQQYIIEFLGKTYTCDPTNLDDPMNCALYRITVRTNSGTDRAMVQLQSHYLAQNQ